MLFKQRLDISMHLGRKSGAIDKKTALGMGQQAVGPLRRKNVAHPCIVGDHCQDGIAVPTRPRAPGSPPLRSGVRSLGMSVWRVPSHMGR